MGHILLQNDAIVQVQTISKRAAAPVVVDKLGMLAIRLSPVACTNQLVNILWIAVHEGQ